MCHHLILRTHTHTHTHTESWVRFIQNNGNFWVAELAGKFYSFYVNSKLATEVGATYIITANEKEVPLPEQDLTNSISTGLAGPSQPTAPIACYKVTHLPVLSGPPSSLPHCTEALLPSLKHILLNCWHTFWQGLFLRLVWARWENRRGAQDSSWYTPREHTSSTILIITSSPPSPLSLTSYHHPHHRLTLPPPPPSPPSPSSTTTTISSTSTTSHILSDPGELKDAEGTCQNTVSHWGQLDHPVQENKICKLGQFTPSWLYRGIFFRVHLTWQSSFCCHKANTCTQLLVSSQ